MRPAKRSGEGSLVFFTVLIQAAAGMCLLREVFLFFARGLEPQERLDEMTGPALALVLLLLGLGSLAAVGHLGRKGAARFALANLRSSWLSREMLLVLAFGTAVAARLALGWLDADPPAVRAILGVAAPLLGLALVGTISRVYLIRTVPAWNSWMTPAAFFGTVLLLGATFFAAAMTMSANLTGPLSEAGDICLKWISAVVAALTVIQIVVANLHFNRFGPQTGRGGRAREEQRVVLGVRFVFAALGAAILLALAWRGASGESRVALSLSLSCILLLVSELIGRFQFYASHRRVGL